MFTYSFIYVNRILIGLDRNKIYKKNMMYLHVDINLTQINQSKTQKRTTTTEKCSFFLFIDYSFSNLLRSIYFIIIINNQYYNIYVCILPINRMSNINRGIQKMGRQEKGSMRNRQTIDCYKDCYFNKLSNKLYSKYSLVLLNKLISKQVCLFSEHMFIQVFKSN